MKAVNAKNEGMDLFGEGGQTGRDRSVNTVQIGMPTRDPHSRPGFRCSAKIIAKLEASGNSGQS